MCLPCHSSLCPCAILHGVVFSFFAPPGGRDRRGSTSTLIKKRAPESARSSAKNRAGERPFVVPADTADHGLPSSLKVLKKERSSIAGPSGAAASNPSPLLRQRRGSFSLRLDPEELCGRAAENLDLVGVGDVGDRENVVDRVGVPRERVVGP